MLQLQQTEGEFPVTPQDVIDRVTKRAAQEIKDLFIEEKWFNWEKHWRHLPIEVFEVLTLEEKVNLWFSCNLDSNLARHLKETEPTKLFDKVRNCLWQYGCSARWNFVVDAYTKLCTFDFGEPEFTTTIDYPWTWMGRGTAEGCNRWIDGGLSYLLHYKGKFVAMLGFSVSRKGLLIQQAQATEKQGNRWMYRLPGRLLDVMVDKLDRHFKYPTYIVDGESQGKYLCAIHPKESPIPKEEVARIAATYDAPIQGFMRTNEEYLTDHRLYWLLEREN